MKLNGEDVEKTPEFVNLLKVLSQHINEDGVSKQVQDNLKDVRESASYDNLNLVYILFLFLYRYPFLYRG